MSSDLLTLSSAALLIGFVHCICGPDHYVPFVVMSRVGVWSLRKTLLVTAICGIGHVLGSAALGFVGIAAGVILFQLESVEHFRGDVAAWLLLAFGAVYMAWGLAHARRRHCHAVNILPTTDPPTCESSATETVGSHSTDPIVSYHATQSSDERTHARGGGAAPFTPWVLFLIFLFGPCEPLIPLLMYPAAQANVWSIVWVTAVFGITTLVTMVAVVALIYWGAFATRWRAMEVYGHAVGGAVVMGCGCIILLQAG